MTKWVRDERGVSLIMAALLMVVLLGMVALAVDIGRLYVARQFLVNSCDAAALAGGIELPNQDKATAKADECADANNMLTHQVSFPADGMTADGPTKLRVDGQMVVAHTFANVLGFSSRQVGAYAVVLKTGSIGWVTDQVVPWGIPFYGSNGQPYDYNNGVEYSLKVGSQTDLANGLPAKVGGNFYPLALERSLGDGGSGASVYRDDIEWGFDGQVKVGDVTDTEPGNMVGPTRQGTKARVDRAGQAPWSDDTWDDFDYGNPRIVLVPIISPLGNGRAEVTVLGFAAFFISSFTGQQVKGYFIGYTIPNAGGTGPDYGVTTFRLIE